MCDRLGVGLRLEGVAVCFQALAQILVVLNDTVVYNGDLALAVPSAEVRMRVAVGRLAVRRPARVADAAGAVEAALFLDLFFQIGDTPLRLDNAQAIPGKCRNARGVIAAVFEAVQPLDQNRKRVFAPRETNNSTHKNNSSK